MSKVTKVVEFYLFYFKKIERSDTLTLGTLVHFSSL